MKPVRRFALFLVAFVLLGYASTRSHADPRQKYVNQQLWHECSEGNLSRVEQLLARGAQVNGADAPLRIAVDNRHYDVVRLLLARGANVNAGDGYINDTPLMIATRNNDTEMLKLLLQAGANPNAVDRIGRTALDQTSWHETPEVRNLLRKVGAYYGVVEAAQIQEWDDLRAMLEQGADPNVANREGITPLMFAATKTGPDDNQADMLNLLLQHGAQVNAADRKGRAALMYAALQGREPETIVALLKADANINQRDKAGRTALLLASDMGNANIVRALLDNGADLQARDHKGMTALMHAANWALRMESAGPDNMGQAVPLLLTRGMDVNTRDNAGRTALFLTTFNAQSDDTLKELIKVGANVNIGDKHGITPLMWAAYYRSKDQITALQAAGARVGLPEALLLNDEATAQTLIANGANVNRRGLYGQTPLMIAARKGFVEVARLLLDKGADIYARDAKGYTALHCALGAAEWWHGPILPGYHAASLTNVAEHPALVALLLARGASVNARTAFGETPLVRAARGGYLQTAQMLLAHGAQTRGISGASALQGALTSRNYELARLLLQHGASSNLHGNKGLTSLHLAVNANDAAMTQALLEAGADANALTPERDTVLMLAVKRDNSALIALLLKHGANVNARDVSGQTALIVAVCSGKSSAVQQLLTAHADTDIKDYDDKTALDYAHEQNHADITTLLSGINRRLPPMPDMKQELREPQSEECR